MGLYRQEKVTLLMNDFGLRMANALPFKRQPDRMAQRLVTCQQLIGDMKHT